MAVSDWFSDEELISQLRMFFTEEERDVIDFKALLGQINMINEDTGEIIVMKRTFRFDMQICDVEEVV